MPGIVALFLVIQQVLEAPDLPEDRAAGIIGAVGVLAAGAITWHWIRGMHRRPRAAARLGALAGFITMFGVSIVLSVALSMLAVGFGEILRDVSANALCFGLLGLGGGLALERLPGLHIGGRVAVGTLGASLVFWVLMRPFASSVSVPILALSIAALSWGGALYFYKPASIAFEGMPVGPMTPESAASDTLPRAALATSVDPAEAPTAVTAPVAAVDPPTPAPAANGDETPRPNEPPQPDADAPAPDQPAPAIPAILVSPGPTPGSLKVDWEGGGRAPYEVQWSPSHDFAQIVGSALSATSSGFIVSGLNPGEPYWVRVRPHDSQRQELWTEAANKAKPC